MRSLSMRMRLFILLLCMFLTTLLLSALWFSVSAKTIENNTIESSAQIIGTTSLYLDSYIMDIQRLLIPIISSEQTRNFLMNSDKDAYRRFLTSNSVEKEIFMLITLDRPDIYGLSLITGNNIASSTRSYLDAERRYLKYVDLVPEAGQFTVIGIEKIGFGNMLALTMAMRFLDSRVKSTSGMLVVDLNLNRIESICQQVELGESGITWLSDRNGRIVFHPDKNLLGQTASAEYLHHFSIGNRGSFKTDINGGEWLVIFNTSLETGMTMVSEIKLNEQTKALMLLNYGTFAFIVSLFLFLFFVIGRAGYRYSQSIILLKNMMQHMESGDLNMKAPEGGEDEIGSLFKSFNRMVYKIRNLIDDVSRSRSREHELVVSQKEALLGAMQSQINPHFLYNTLEVINSYAILDGNEKVSSMIVSLSEIFRYSIDSPISIVPLKEEIMHLRSYLQIQKERFENLQFHINVTDEDIDKVQGVRLMLQPLIENSFKHGFDKHKLRPGVCTITGRAEGSHYIVDVTDSGIGMGAQIRDELNRAFNGEETEASMASLKSRTIGLMNVHSRIRMIFGDEYGLYILRSGDDGTTIRITLPFDQPKEMEDISV